ALDVARVGDAQVVDGGGEQRRDELGDAVVDVPGADRGGELRVIAESELREALAVRTRRCLAELELALDDSGHVGGHAGVKTEGAGRVRHHLVGEDLAQRRNQLCGGRDPALAHAAASCASMIRSVSYSCSAVRRPIAASSTDRVAPPRWRDAWTMHITP